MEGVRSGAEERVRILGAEATEREAKAHEVERELRLEREWRTSLQEASISNAEKISQLHQEIYQLRRVSEVRSPSLSPLPYCAPVLGDQTSKWSDLGVTFRWQRCPRKFCWSSRNWENRYLNRTLEKGNIYYGTIGTELGCCKWNVLFDSSCLVKVS